MKYSIVVPAYNVAQYLPDCLESIRQQSEREFEVIIVDDGSTDSTGRIANEFSARDSRFLVLSKENGGVSSARNLGLEYASCEYVWFIDGDDYVHPDSLSFLSRMFESYPDAEYVSFDYLWTRQRYDGSFPVLSTLALEEPRLFNCQSMAGFEDALRHSPIAVCCVCYRKSLAEAARFRDFGACEDRLYALEMCFAARAGVKTDAKLYSYFQRRGSATHSATRRRMSDFFLFSDALLDLRDFKSGWGSNYLRFAYCTEIFPAMMRQLRSLPASSDRSWAFEEMLERMERVQRALPGYNYEEIENIVENRSFVLAWIYLHLRYVPRRFLERHPVVLMCYQRLVSAWRL